MVIFNSYVKLPEGIQKKKEQPEKNKAESHSKKIRINKNLKNNNIKEQKPKQLGKIQVLNLQHNWTPGLFPVFVVLFCFSADSSCWVVFLLNLCLILIFFISLIFLLKSSFSVQNGLLRLECHHGKARTSWSGRTKPQRAAWDQSQTSEW